MPLPSRLFDENRLRSAMAQAGVDAIVMRGNTNPKYLSSFMHNGGNLGYRPFVVFYFLDPKLAPVLVVPAVDLHLAQDSSWIEDVRAYAMAEFFTDVDAEFHVDFFAAAKSVIADRGMDGMTIGTEGDDLTQGFRARLESLFPTSRFVDFGGEMEIVRMVKTPEEIRRLRRACEITVKAHESFRDAIKVGASDRDLVEAAATRMFEEGADGIHFINVGTGPLGYAAHSPYPIDYTLRRGDFAKVDMGALIRGYPADFVRSYYLGECSQRQKDVYRWLNDAQLELGFSLAPGMTGGEVFERGHQLISQHLQKFPREFVAHGLGLGTHEEPRCNAVNQTVLEAGTVICVEYSYYSDGVRFHTEDTFLVEDTGVQHWTAELSRELVVPI